MENLPLVSVIITTKNEEKNIESCLRSIKKQNYSNIEIIVVDNDSFGSAKEAVETFSEREKVTIKYFIQPKQSNSKTANMGIEKSNGEIIAFIDDDAIADENWLKEIEKTFEKKEVNIGYIVSIMLM